jgi:hypothetical protein
MSLPGRAQQIRNVACAVTPGRQEIGLDDYLLRAVAYAFVDGLGQQRRGELEVCDSHRPVGQAVVQPPRDLAGRLARLGLATAVRQEEYRPLDSH